MQGKRSTWFLLSYMLMLLFLILSLSASTALAAPTHRAPFTRPGFGLRPLKPHTYHVSPRITHVTPMVRHVKPKTAGTVTEYPIPTSGGGTPYSITQGPDGNLWFTENDFSSYYGCNGNSYQEFSCIGMLTPGGTFTIYPIPLQTGCCNVTPEGITTGPDGNLWFTMQYSNGSIWSLSTGGTFTEYPIPLYSTPYAITAGPDGNLWFTDTQGSAIWSVTTAGTFTIYPLPYIYDFPLGITAGPSGTNTVWFTEQGYWNPPNYKFPSQIGSINVGTGHITEYRIPGKYPYPYFPQPAGITQGPNSTLWFTEAGVSKLGVINSKTGKITQYQIPTYRSNPQGIALGADGNLWFAENAVGKITSSTPGGSLTEYRLPTVSRHPQSITAGPNNDLWFTEQGTNMIASITTS